MSFKSIHTITTEEELFDWLVEHMRHRKPKQRYNKAVVDFVNQFIEDARAEKGAFESPGPEVFDTQVWQRNRDSVLKSVFESTGKTQEYRQCSSFLVAFVGRLYDESCRDPIGFEIGSRIAIRMLNKSYGCSGGKGFIDEEWRSDDSLLVSGTRFLRHFNLHVEVPQRPYCRGYLSMFEDEELE